MNKTRTLVVEDEPELAELVANFLNRYEFCCDIVSTGNQAVDYINSHNPELVLLDIMLPDIDGVSVFKQIKDSFSGKVVMLTAVKDTVDQVIGLELGADDYIAKPVDPRLLLARLRALLRRVSHQSNKVNQEHVLVQGEIELNPLSNQAKLAGQLLSLSTPEFNLLKLFLLNPGQIISRDELYRNLKGTEYDGQNRQIDINVSQLRSKLEQNTSVPQFIKTVRNKGYVFIPHVEGKPV